MKQINYKLIGMRRSELGLTQAQVAEKVAALSGSAFSQQAYRKVEKGESKHSKYLAYVCVALGLKLSDVDPAFSVELDKTKESLIAKINDLPEDERIAIVQAVLTAIRRD